jgi:hypothetical protein
MDMVISVFRRCFRINRRVILGLWCLTPLSTIFYNYISLTEGIFISLVGYIYCPRLLLNLFSSIICGHWAIKDIYRFETQLKLFTSDILPLKYR